MKVVFLTTIIFVVFLIHEVHMTKPALKPCVLQSDIRAYNTFAKRHIISKQFPRDSLEEWASYLRLNDLCGRTPKQSFIDAKPIAVRHICTDLGRLVQDAPESQGDFCMSASTMKLYDVYSDTNCNISKLDPVDRYVIVQCANVDGLCLPIHFESFKNQKPSKAHCTEPKFV